MENCFVLHIDRTLVWKSVSAKLENKISLINNNYDMKSQDSKIMFVIIVTNIFTVTIIT